MIHLILGIAFIYIAGAVIIAVGTLIFQAIGLNLGKSKKATESQHPTQI